VYTPARRLFLIEMIRMSDTARETSTADGAAEDSGRPQATQPQSSPPRLSASSLPPKIQAVIGARLGQLSAQARELAQMAAVVGREFTFPLLLAASSADEESLVMGLDELWQRRIVREQADGYDFSHDRIREVAYAEISRVRRRFLHRRVASALESLYAGEIAAVYVQIAAHYQEAGEKERAQHYHRHAAEYAMDRFVAEEALRHLLAALDLTSIDDTATARDLARKRMEEHFDLLVMLQKVYTWQARLVEWGLTLEKMEALAHRMDDDRRRAQSAVYRAEWFYKHGRAEERCDKAQEAIALAQRAGAAELIVAGYIQWGLSRYDISRFSEARPLLQKGAALAHQAGLPNEEGRALEMLAALGMFSGMSAAEIQQILERCWVIANRQKDVPFMAAICNKFGYVIVAQGEGQYDKALHQYELCIQYSRSVGDVVHEAQCLLNLIVLETIQGNYAGSMNRIRTYLALPQGTMTPENRGRYLNYWGDFLINVGMFEFAHRQQRESLNLLTHHVHRRRLSRLPHRLPYPQSSGRSPRRLGAANGMGSTPAPRRHH
jgi:predicted ATPase